MAKLVSRLNIISKEYGGALEDAVRDTAEWILNRTKELSPVDSGTLKESYEARQGRDYKHWFVGTTVYYAPFMEYGFRHWKSGRFIGPYPHITPAFYRGEDYFKQALIKAVKSQKDTNG